MSTGWTVSSSSSQPPPPPPPLPPPPPPPRSNNDSTNISPELGPQKGRQNISPQNATGGSGGSLPVPRSQATSNTNNNNGTTSSISPTSSSTVPQNVSSQGAGGNNNHSLVNNNNSFMNASTSSIPLTPSGAAPLMGGNVSQNQTPSLGPTANNSNGRSPDLRAGTPSTSGINFDPETHVEVYNTQQNALLILAYNDILYLPPLHEVEATGGFKLCPNFDSSRPFDSCLQGVRCQYVHARLDNAVSHDIHMNYAWNTLEEVTYQCFTGGQMLSVAPPNASIATDEIPSHLVLKTRALQSNRRVISHCAHYYFNRVCNRGSGCYFVHAISLVPIPNHDDPNRRMWGRTQQRRGLSIGGLSNSSSQLGQQGHHFYLQQQHHDQQHQLPPPSHHGMKLNANVANADSVRSTPPLAPQRGNSIGGGGAPGTPSSLLPSPAGGGNSNNDILLKNDSLIRASAVSNTSPTAAFLMNHQPQNVSGQGSSSLSNNNNNTGGRATSLGSTFTTQNTHNKPSSPNTANNGLSYPQQGTSGGSGTAGGGAFSSNSLSSKNASPTNNNLSGNSINSNGNNAKSVSSNNNNNSNSRIVDENKELSPYAHEWNPGSTPPANAASDNNNNNKDSSSSLSSQQLPPIESLPPAMSSDQQQQKSKDGDGSFASVGVDSTSTRNLQNNSTSSTGNNNNNDDSQDEQKMLNDVMNLCTDDE